MSDDADRLDEILAELGLTREQLPEELLELIEGMGAEVVIIGMPELTPSDETLLQASRFALRRLMEMGVHRRPPWNHTAGISMLLTALSAYFEGKEPSDHASPLAKDAYALVTEAMTIGVEGEPESFVINTAIGAATAMEHWGHMERYAKSLREPTWPDWRCPMCMKVYPEHFEPDKCPDCDCTLVRSKEASA